MAVSISLTIDAKGFKGAAKETEQAQTRIERAVEKIVTDVERIQKAFNTINTGTAQTSVRLFQSAVNLAKVNVLQDIGQIQAAFATLASTIAKVQPAAAVAGTAAGVPRSRPQSSGSGSDPLANKLILDVQRFASTTDIAKAAWRDFGAIVAGEAGKGVRAMRELGVATQLVEQRNRAFAESSIAISRLALHQDLERRLAVEKQLAGSVGRLASVEASRKAILAQSLAGVISNNQGLLTYRDTLEKAAKGAGRFAEGQTLLKKGAVLLLGPLSRLGAQIGALTSLYFGFGGQTAAVLAAIAALTLGLAKAVRAATEFETAIVTVARTTGLADDEVKKLADSLLRLSTVTGVPAAELAQIATVAGQLGITAVGDLEAFAEAVSKISRVSNLTADSATNAFGRILVLTGEPFTNVKNLAAAVTQLGNSFAGTEAEIANTAIEISKIGGVVGLSSDEVVGFAAAFVQAGVSASNAGSSLGRVLLSIREHARAGGEGLAKLQEVVGESFENLRVAAETDISTVFVAFAEGLSRIEEEGGSAVQALREFGLSGVREAKSLLPLITRVDQTRRAIEEAKEAFDAASATDVEFERRQKSLSAQSEILGTALKNIAITVGNEILPAITSLVTALAGLFSQTQVLSTGFTALALALAAYPALFVAVLTGAKALDLAARSLGLAFVTSTPALAAFTVQLSLYTAAAYAGWRASRQLRDAFNMDGLDAVTERFDRARQAAGLVKLSVEAIESATRQGFGDNENIRRLEDDIKRLAKEAPTSAEAMSELRVKAESLFEFVKKLTGFNAKLPIDLEEVAKAAEKIDDLVDSLGSFRRQAEKLKVGTAGRVLINTDSLAEAVDLLQKFNVREKGEILSALGLAKAQGTLSQALGDLIAKRKINVATIGAEERAVAALIDQVALEEAALKELSEALVSAETFNFQALVTGFTEVDKAVIDATKGIIEQRAVLEGLGVDVGQVLTEVEASIRNAFRVQFLEEFNKKLRELRFDTATAGFTAMAKAVAGGTREIIEMARQAGISGDELTKIAKQAGDAFRENFQASTFNGIIDGIRNVIKEARKLTFVGPQAERNKALDEIKQSFEEGTINAEQLSAAVKGTNNAFDALDTGNLIQQLGGVIQAGKAIDAQVSEFGTKFTEGEETFNQFGLTMEEQVAGKAGIALEAFKNLAAAGFDPTIKAMQELKDQANSTSPSFDTLAKILGELQGKLSEQTKGALKPFDPLIKSAEEALAEDGPVRKIADVIAEIKKNAAEVVFNVNTEDAMKKLDELAKAAARSGAANNPAIGAGLSAMPAHGGTNGFDAITKSAEKAQEASNTASQSIQKDIQDAGQELEAFVDANGNLQIQAKSGPATEAIDAVDQEYAELRKTFDEQNEIKLGTDEARTNMENLLAAAQKYKEFLSENRQEMTAGLAPQTPAATEGELAFQAQLEAIRKSNEAQKAAVEASKQATEALKTQATEAAAALDKVKEPVTIDINTDDLLKEMPNLENFERVFAAAREGAKINLEFDEDDSERLGRLVQQFGTFKQQAETPVNLNITTPETLPQTSAQIESISTALRGIQEVGAVTAQITAPENLSALSTQIGDVSKGLTQIKDIGEVAIVATASEDLPKIATNIKSLATDTKIVADNSSLNIQAKAEVEEAFKAVNALATELGKIPREVIINIALTDALSQVAEVSAALDTAVKTARSVNVDISQGLAAAQQLSIALDQAVEKIRVARIQVQAEGSPSLPFSQYFGPNGYAAGKVAQFAEEASASGVTIPVDTSGATYPDSPAFAAARGAVDPTGTRSSAVNETEAALVTATGALNTTVSGNTTALNDSTKALKAVSSSLTDASGSGGTARFIETNGAWTGYQKAFLQAKDFVEGPEAIAIPNYRAQHELAQAATTSNQELRLSMLDVQETTTSATDAFHDFYVVVGNAAVATAQTAAEAERLAQAMGGIAKLSPDTSLEYEVKASGSPTLPFSEYFNDYIPKVIRNSLNGISDSITIPIALDRSALNKPIKLNSTALPPRETDNTRNNQALHSAVKELITSIKTNNTLTLSTLAEKLDKIVDHTSATAGATRSTAAEISGDRHAARLQKRIERNVRREGNRTFKLK